MREERATGLGAGGLEPGRAGVLAWGQGWWGFSETSDQRAGRGLGRYSGVNLGLSGCAGPGRHFEGRTQLGLWEGPGKTATC